MEYIELFTISLLSSTLLPGGSEVYFIYLLRHSFDPALLLIIATVGNTSGSVINYLIGRFSVVFLTKKGIGFNEEKLQKGKHRIGKWGDLALLLSFLPVIGDPVTAAAGVIKYSFVRFILLVTIGKFFRYTIVYLGYWKINTLW